MEYQTKIETRNLDNNNLTRFPLDASFRGVTRLFVLAFDNTDNGNKKVERNSHAKYFLPRVNITKYNVLIMAETSTINQLMIKSKSMTRLERLQQGKGMTTQQDVC